MHIAAQEIAKIIINKPFGSLLGTHTIISGKRQQVDLKFHARVVQRAITVVAHGIIRIALGVSQYRTIAFELNVEHNVIEHQQLLLIAILEQDIIARQCHQATLIALFYPIFIEAILSRIVHIELYSLLLHCCLEYIEALLQCFGCILKCVFSNMRCKHYSVDAHRLLASNQLQRLFHRLCAMVNARQQMTVHIGVIEQLRFLFLSKKVKHIRIRGIL